MLLCLEKKIQIFKRVINKSNFLVWNYQDNLLDFTVYNLFIQIRVSRDFQIGLIIIDANIMFSLFIKCGYTLFVKVLSCKD